MEEAVHAGDLASGEAASDAAEISSMQAVHVAQWELKKREALAAVQGASSTAVATRAYPGVMRQANANKYRT